MRAILAEWHQGGGHLPATSVAADGRRSVVRTEVVIRPAAEEVRDAVTHEQNDGEGMRRNGTRDANATARADVPKSAVILNMDFNTSSVKDEKSLDMGRDLPKGKYVATVEKIEKDTNGNTPALKFTFSVVAGPYTNRKVFERLFLTEKANGRVILFGNRLGLIAEKELGKESVRKNWKDAIGKKVVIEVENREYEARDGSKKQATNLTYGGIFKMDDPKVAEVVSAAGAPKAAPTAGAATQAAFDDLLQRVGRGATPRRLRPPGPVNVPGGTRVGSSLRFRPRR